MANINMKLNMNVGGLFKLEVRKAATNELVSSIDWFHNLVLDQGLDFMATDAWYNGCAVGTDGTPPTATQTDLGNRVAKMTTTATATSNFYNQDGIVYAYMRKRYRFNAGTFKNITLAEVAIISSSEKCWNRALITDADGRPTTITVLADEYLDVTCEVRCYLNTADVSGTFEVVDKTDKVLKTIGTTTRLACLNTNIGYYLDYSLTQWVNHNMWKTYLCTGKIGASNISSSGSYYEPSECKRQTYVNGSHQVTSELTWGLDKANNVDLQTVFTSSGYIPAWQIGFSEPIRKTNTQTLTFKVTLSWGRYDAA